MSLARILPFRCRQTLRRASFVAVVASFALTARAATVTIDTLGDLSTRGGIITSGPESVYGQSFRTPDASAVRLDSWTFFASTATWFGSPSTSVSFRLKLFELLLPPWAATKNDGDSVGVNLVNPFYDNPAYPQYQASGPGPYASGLLFESSVVTLSSPPFSSPVDSGWGRINFDVGVQLDPTKRYVAFLDQERSSLNDYYLLASWNYPSNQVDGYLVAVGGSSDFFAAEDATAGWANYGNEMVFSATFSTIPDTGATVPDAGATGFLLAGGLGLILAVRCRRRN